MTKNEFNALCGKYLIAPEIALDNDDLQMALTERNDNEVERILKTEF